MIDIEKFNEIRLTKHLIVLDTNVLLELYRQPANISVDIISALEQIRDNIYLPRQVYDEYIQNCHKTCGDERRKYTIKGVCIKSSCREIIATSKSLEHYQEEVRKVSEGLNNFGESLQKVFQQNIDVYGNLAKIVSDMPKITVSPEVQTSLSAISEMAKPLILSSANIDLQGVISKMEPLASFSVQLPKIELEKVRDTEESIVIENEDEE